MNDQQTKQGPAMKFRREHRGRHLRESEGRQDLAQRVHYTTLQKS